MILTEQQIIDIIEHNPNKGLVDKAKKYNKDMRLHLYGEGMKEAVTEIKGFEQPALKELRAKYAKSNKDLAARLVRPMDKVFTARGGSVYYNLQGTSEKKAHQLAANIRDNMSVKKWNASVWKPHYIDDPMGLVFMEMGDGKGYPIGKAYPTYKPITDVYDYLPKGSMLEYVVFTVSQKELKKQGIDTTRKIYRVVDDAFDYYVEKGASITILTEFTLPNQFKQVPAMLNSDIIDPACEGMMLSPLDAVIELADQFFLKGSIKITHEFLHGFPKYWQYADGCTDCGGSGLKSGETCDSCKGTGKRINIKVSDVMLLEVPDKDSHNIAPDVAGYVSPDKTYYDIAVHDLSHLEAIMKATLWGIEDAPKVNTTGAGSTEGEKTATQIVDDKQPMIDRLFEISESAERRHKFIIDMGIRVQINPNHEGSSVNYGKRFGIEGPDVIWEKYSYARTQGAAQSVLDDLLLEYYEAKYSTDPVKLSVQIKLMKVEPFVHYKTMEVKALMPAEEDYKMKLYFSEWLSQMEEPLLLVYTPDLLRDSLREFAAAKKLPAPEPEKKPAFN